MLIDRRRELLSIIQKLVPVDLAEVEFVKGRRYPVLEVQVDQIENSFLWFGFEISTVSRRCLYEARTSSD